MAAATAFSALAFTPAASADIGDITILSVSSPTPPSGNAGQMTVTTESGSQITYLDVLLYDPQGHLELMIPFSDFTEIGAGTGSQSNEEFWSVQNPITTNASGGLPGLAPGTYTATADATDADGAETGLTGGTFPFLIQPFVTLSANPSAISYTQQTVKFSGQATEVVPGTTSPAPFANEQIQIVGPTTTADPTGSYSVTTDSEGNFQLSVQPQPDNYYASLQGSASMTGAQSPIVAITDSPTPIRLAAKFTQDAIEYGQTDVMTGTLKYYQSAKTLKPLPNTTITIARLSPPGEPKITAKTNAAGAFRASIPRQTATGSWAVTAGGTALLGKALVTRTLPVHQTTGFKRTSIELSAFGVLTVKTCLVDTSPGRSSTQVNSPIALEYGHSAKGRWKQLITIEPTYGVRYCPGRSPLWTIAVNAPDQNAYYRLRFAGTQTLRVSVSKVRHLWREDTRITSFKISPHHLHGKGAITISGRLWRAATAKNSSSSAHSGPWTPYAGRKVGIYFIFNGSEYEFNSEPKTNAQGYFSGLFAANETARWLAQYNGDKTHFGCRTARVKVTVS
ncbi:MAG: hypothetical protein ACRDPO_33455, partial [Streptosporangiaceae bacterium]